MISIPLLWGLVLRLSGASRTVADGCGVRNFQGSRSVSHDDRSAETSTKPSRGRRLHRQGEFRRHPQTACRCRTSAAAGETPAPASASPQGRARPYADWRASRGSALWAQWSQRVTPPTRTLCPIHSCSCHACTPSITMLCRKRRSSSAASPRATPADARLSRLCRVVCPAMLS